MEVRKPGRPLSNCPCRPGKPCACGAVKVAIPKKQKCGGCPPDSQTQTASSSREHSPTQSIQSPTANSFRVTKAALASRNGRKLSFDPSHLFRIGPSTVKMISPGGVGLDAGMIATSMAMVPNGIASSQPLNLTGYGAGAGVPNMAFSPVFNMGYGSHLPLNISVPYRANGHVPQHIIKMEDDLSSPYPGTSNLDLASPIVSTPQPYSLGSRHRRSSSGSGPDYLVGLASLGTPSMTHSTPNTGPAPASCCGGGKEANNAIVTNLSSYSKPLIPHYEPPGETKHHNAHAPMDMSTVFTYPAQYGSWNMPINPQMWQQITSGSQPSMAAPPMPTAPNNTIPDLGISHQCTCGPGCQCLGCLVHPFNDQTYQYVNSAYMEGNGINGHSTPSSPGINGVNGVNITNGINASNGINGHSGIHGGGAVNGTKRVEGINGTNGHNATNGNAVNGSPASPDTKPGSCCAPAAATAQTPAMPPESPKQVPESPPEARTPSEASGHGEEQQTLSEFDYLWVAMPPREEDGCYGLMASCPCGDDCRCVGCTLHNP